MQNFGAFMLLFSECLPTHPNSSLTTLSLILLFLLENNTPLYIVPADQSH